MPFWRFHSCIMGAQSSVEVISSPTVIEAESHHLYTGNTPTNEGQVYRQDGVGIETSSTPLGFNVDWISAGASLT